MKYDFYAVFKPTDKDYDERDKRYKRFCTRYGYPYKPCKREPLYKEEIMADGTTIRKRVK